jgi:integrase
MRDLDKPDAARWEVPAERMKMKRAYVVPVSGQAVVQPSLKRLSAPYRCQQPPSSPKVRAPDRKPGSS